MPKKPSNTPKLPKEAIAFAKSMGLDLNGLEPEAEDIWKMLDKMSSSQPAQYDEFIAQQFSNAKAESESGNGDDGRKSFRPTAGYCIQTGTKAGDGLKIREIKSGEYTGKTLFLNICSSVVIEEPVDKNGQPIPDNRSVADGLSIPLIVGPVRDHIPDGDGEDGDENVVDSIGAGSGSSRSSSNAQLVVDVVVHPKVVNMALKEKYFSAQIAALALDWVIQESGIECSRKWERFDGAKYVGGRGDDRQTPMLFFVDSEGKPVPAVIDPTTGNTAGGDRANEKSALGSTSSLLDQLQKDKAAESIAGGGSADRLDILNTGHASALKKPVVDIALTEGERRKQQETLKTQLQQKEQQKGNATGKTRNSKPLIQEVGAPNPPAAPVASVAPPGVSPSLLKPEEMSDAATRATSTKQQRDEQPKKQIDPCESATSAEVEVQQPIRSGPSKKEYALMESMLSNMDNEFGSVVAATAEEMNADAANTMIADLAKVLGGGDKAGAPTLDPSSFDMGALNKLLDQQTNVSASSSSNSSKRKSSTTGIASTEPQTVAKPPFTSVPFEQEVVLSNALPSIVQVSLSTSEVDPAVVSENGGTGTNRKQLMTLQVSALSSTLDTSHMELLVSDKEVQIRLHPEDIVTPAPSSLPVGSLLTFGMSYKGSAFKLIESSATASFKKKKGTLSVKIEYTKS